ncbi:MAG: HIT domain-containing protein [Planctomycetales bacterium]|nr:HIT domain-containing protein [Planctomycetales bacterium]
MQGLGPAGVSRCPFCPLAEPGDEAGRFVLARGRTAFVVLNIYPYTIGHVLVVPNRHLARTSDLSPEERAEALDLAIRVEEALRAEYGAEGFNIGMNVGRAGGAAVADHLHLHVVPRYTGDSNFVPVVGGTRVMPEAIEDTYRRLRPRLDGTGRP